MNDIKTVFYFEPNQSTYEANWNAGKISSRTIVFVADTGSIYKNGRLYGKMSKTDIKNIVNEIYNENPSDFPLRDSIEGAIDQIEYLRQDHLSRINRLASLITDIKKWEKTDIERISQDVIKDYQWLKDYIENNPSTKVLKLIDFGDKADDWAISYIIPTSDGLGGLTFSSLLASHKELLARVANIKPGLTDSSGNTITYELLVSLFKVWLENSEEFGNLETVLAQMSALWSEIDADTINVLKWMAASFRAGANSLQTFAEMLTSMYNGTGSTETSSLAGVIARITAAEGRISTLTSLFSEINGRLSAVETWIDNADGRYVAGVDLESKVGLLLDNISGGLHIKVDEIAKTATTYMISDVSTVDANNNRKITATSIVEAITSDSEAAGSLSAYYASQNNEGLTGELVLAVVKNTVKASIDAASWEVYCQYIQGDRSDIANLKLLVDGEGSSMTIRADKIDLDGLIPLLFAEEAFVDNLFTNNLSINNGRPAGYASHSWGLNINKEVGFKMEYLSGQPGYRDVFQIVGNTVYMEHNGETTILLNSDGSGSVARGSLSWNNEGELSTSIKGIFNVLLKNVYSEHRLYTGINKIVKIGNYYMVFIKGILVYCDTKDPVTIDVTTGHSFILPSEFTQGTIDPQPVDLGAELYPGNSGLSI